jgi:putative ABC transport system permease protein
LRSVLRKDALDHEVASELAFHFDQLVREYSDRGMTMDEARLAARRRLGNVPALEEQCRDQRRVTWIHDVQQDLAFGLRMLRKSPGFTAVAVASLALGIGANVATLGAIDALLFAALPYADADRLVVVRTYTVDNPARNEGATVSEYFAWKDGTRTLDRMGVSLADQADFGADGDGTPAERIAGVLSDPDLFRTLGVQPELGRVFTEAETRAGSRSVIVLSHGLWKRRFGGDTGVLGKRIRLNGADTTIVGVMPSRFHYPNDRVEYWIPFRLARGPQQGSARFYVVVGRVKNGVTLQQAEMDLSNLAIPLAKDFPEVYDGRGVHVQTLRETFYGWTKSPVATLQAGVLLVLLIACANVAGLLLARGTVRRPEISLRIALGAGRGRIVRQLLAESLLLSAIGGVMGLIVTWWGLRAVTTMLPLPGWSRIPEVSLNGRILVLTVGLSMATGLVFGMVPAIAGSGSGLFRSFKDSGRGGNTGARPNRLRSALVSCQIALALVLLIGTGLLLNSFVRLASRDLNFDPRGLLTLEFRIPPASYLRQVGVHQGFPYFDVSPMPAQTLERIYNRLRLLPGAQSAAGISHPPVSSLIVPRIAISTDGAMAPGRASVEARTTVYFLVTPNYFTTTKTAIVRGREIDVRDTASAPWAVVVNETMARKFWPGQDPIGRRFTLDTVPEERPREVVGVARDVPLGRGATEFAPIVYASFLQQPSRSRGPWPGMFGQMTFLIRSQDPLALAPAARRAVAEIEPDRPLSNIFPMDGFLDQVLLARHSYVFVLGVFAIASTLLAAIGIYGVTSYAVAQRTREIGIRIALGASARDLIALVGSRVLMLVVVGLLSGLVSSLLLTRFIKAQLFRVTPTDPTTFAGLSVLVALVAFLACWMPLRRALRVDPTVALKQE